jgi:hypothetical protein
MTLRANITTTYRDANASRPHAPKNVQKETADQGVHESEGTRNPMKPSTKAPDQGAVPLTELGGNRSAVRSIGQTSATVDAFERSSPKDESIVAQGAGPDRPASDLRPDTNEREVASKPALAGYGSGSGESTTKKTVQESPASRKHSTTVADYNLSERPGSTVKKVAPLELTKNDKSQETSCSRKSDAPESPSQSLPVAKPPKIRLAEPSAKAATGNAAASFSTADNAPASASDEDAMQRELTAALQFEQPQKDNLQTESATGGDVAKHLQSEGVFGISASGRSLGTVDFIRQKQFEYTMDQKPFTADDLLLEAEKAIHGTLNSDQRSVVSKSLLQAAESINAYRNQSVRSSEHAENAAKPSRPAASARKEDA